MENMPNPLHQVISEQLPLIVILPPLVVSVVALILSAYNAHINHTRTSRSEQLKTSREVWSLINEKYDPIKEIGRTKGWPKDKSSIIGVPAHMVWSLVREIDYFAYLVLVDEIKDEKVLGYYRHYLSHNIITIMRYYASSDDRRFLYEDYKNLYGLIEKWNINVPDEET